MSVEGPPMSICRNACGLQLSNGGKVLMIWGRFAAAGVGEVHQIRGIMDGITYLRIVRDIGLPNITALIGPGYIYQ